MQAVVVNYKENEYLDECIGSLKRFGISEIFLVTHSPVRNYYEGVKVLEVSGGGYASCVNKGVKCTTSEYVAIMNADVRFEKGEVKDIINIMGEDDRIAVIGPFIKDVRGHKFHSHHPFPSPLHIFRETFLPFFYVPPRKNGWVSGCVFFVRRKAFEEVGGFDENFFLFWEEVDFMERLSQKNWKILYYPGVEVIHYGGKFNSAERIFEWHKSMVYYFKKRKQFFSPAIIGTLRCISRIIAWTLLAPFDKNLAIEKIKGYALSFRYLSKCMMGK